MARSWPQHVWACGLSTRSALRVTDAAGNAVIHHSRAVECHGRVFMAALYIGGRYVYGAVLQGKDGLAAVVGGWRVKARW